MIDSIIDWKQSDERVSGDERKKIYFIFHQFVLMIINQNSFKEEKNRLMNWLNLFRVL